MVTAELVSTGVELANREVEVAQLRQALTSRVWIEQAKGVLAATRGVSPDEAFQRLRAQARSSLRKLADLAQEIVQEAQRERVAALAVDDARGSGGRGAGPAGRAGAAGRPDRAGPTHRSPGPGAGRCRPAGASR